MLRTGFRGLVSTVAAVAVATTALLAFSAAPAHAANPGCGFSCDGVDPNSAAVEDANGALHLCRDSARTVYSRSEPGNGYVDLRYSSYCRIAWARGVAQEIKVVSFWHQNDPESAARRVEIDYSSSGGYTLAVNDAGLYAEACVYVAYGGWVCTPRF
jgi:hypothetical protein